MDRFTRICLLLIVLLLAIVASRPMISPQPVHAAMYTEYDAYVVAQTQVNQLPVALNKAVGGGWEVIGVTSLPDFDNGSNAVLVILAR